MIITLAGNNSFALQQRLNQILNDFKKKFGELSLERIEGEETTAEGLIDSLKSLPFLASRKLVIVRDLSLNKAAAENIEQIISSVGDECDLIIYEPNIDRRSVYSKVLKSKTELEEFTSVDARNLGNWLVGEAKKQDAMLSLADANYLVERIGEDQQLLASELTKLVTYDPAISRENIDLLTEKAPQSRVFDLLDAAFKGQTKRALELYEEQRAQKIEPQAILAMITWQLNLMALASLGRDKSSEQIAKATGGSAFPIEKAKHLAAKAGPANVVKLIEEAYRIDLGSKSKPIDPDEALKTFITTL